MSDYGSDEKLFASRMKDLARSAEKGKICFSDFLTPTERSQIICMKDIAGCCNIDFDGGYPDAERVRAKFSPVDFDYEVESPVKAVKIRWRMGTLSHRDVLGSVLGLGISRGKIGDIIVGDGECTVICDGGVLPYITENLVRVGKVGVTSEECHEVKAVEKEQKIIDVSVVSLRLDILVSEGFSVPRSQASEMIRSGFCFVNWVKTESPSYTVKIGDVITLRGKGRVTFYAIGGQSRKGKTFIKLLK